MPFGLWVAGLCARFPGRLPSEVMAEVARLPVGMLDDICEAWNFRTAFEMTQAADEMGDGASKRLPKDRLFELVREFEFGMHDDEEDDGDE